MTLFVIIFLIQPVRKKLKSYSDKNRRNDIFEDIRKHIITSSLRRDLVSAKNNYTKKGIKNCQFLTELAGRKK